MAMELMDMKVTLLHSSLPFSSFVQHQDSIGLISAHDKRFVLCRRMFQQGLGRTAISSFFPQEEYAARRFIKKVSASPNNLKAHCLEHAGAIILKVAYGYELQDTESRVDPMVHIVNIAMENFNKATAPGGFLVNQLHILMKMPDWFPGASFKRLGRSWAKDYWKMVDIPFNYVKQQIVQGTAKESFTATWLSQNLSYQDELNLKHTSSSMFGAGVDTSAVTFYAFYFAMAKYPTIQKMAQAEIDSVVGRDRLPNFLDRAHMPYIEALCKEITRYHVAVPNGMPHCTSRDDIHDGMFIPAGAIVMANIWSMAHDPKVYNHPMEFNPMRFLGEYPEQNPREYVWGFGRRICPGRLLADASIFITVALTLAVFDIRLTPDAPTILKPIPGIVSDIEPFNCIITFRDLDAEKLIHLLD
ncbi:cytochrome P450 [Mycena floridula]|nr:cytochrome P450 [Mycena floridula]